ncbi:MAG: hypothetical protein KGV51_07525 [Moraxellaceae bacterium]|nr:hypothetical protein [Moraxellaceae bacterium]
MKTLTLNLDDQLYDDITRNVGDVSIEEYIQQILHNHFLNLIKKTNNQPKITLEEKREKLAKLAGSWAD